MTALFGADLQSHRASSRYVALLCTRRECAWQCLTKEAPSHQIMFSSIFDEREGRLTFPVGWIAS